KHRNANDLRGVPGAAVNGVDNYLLQHGCPYAPRAERAAEGEPDPTWRRNIRQFSALTTTMVALENTGWNPPVPSTPPGPRAQFRQQAARPRPRSRLGRFGLCQPQPMWEDDRMVTTPLPEAVS